MIEHTHVHHATVAVSGGRFICCLPRCSLGKLHFKHWRDHVEMCLRLATDGQPVGEDVFECCCGERAFTPEGLLKHIYRHLRTKEPVTCPYRNCIYRFCDYQNFYRHRKSCHQGEQPKHVQSTRRQQPRQPDDPGCSTNALDSDCDMAAENISDVSGAGFVGDSMVEPSDPFVVPPCAQAENRAPPWFVSLDSNIDTRNVLLYLAMNATFRVPKVKIANALQQIDIYGSAWASETYPELFSEILRINNVDTNAAERIASQLIEAIVRHPPHAAFYDTVPTVVSTAYRVAKFMKKHMRYVHPEDIVTSMRLRTGHCPLVKGSGVYADMEKKPDVFCEQ